MHQLLSRQIKKYLPSKPEDSDEFNEFLNIVSDTYRLYEQELAHLNESKKLNEVESHKANEPLNNRAEERKESIDKLKETLQKTGISENSINLENDIFHLSKILEEQKEITTGINNELKNNIQRLRTLIHNHPSAILLETETRKIAFTNQSFCNLFGIPIPPNQLFGADCSESADQTKHLFVDSDVFVKRIDELISNKKPVTNELVYLNDGKILERSFIPIITDDSYIGHFWSYDDVTERKKIESSLVENERRLSATLNASLDAIINVDDQLNVIFWNPKAESLFGWEENEVIGKNLASIIVPERHRENNEISLLNHPENSNELLLNKLIELPALRRDGKELIIELSIAPIKIDNQFIYCLFVRDISERIKSQRAIVKSEEKYKRIIANMNLGLLEVDNNDIIQYVNNSFLKLSGYKRHELLNKKASQIFLKGKNYDFLTQKISSRMEGISDVFEISVFNKTNEVRWWLISGAPNFDENGKVIGSIGIHLDITRQKETEHQLSLAKEIAEKSSKAKETFLTNMSHEIRTPLHGIIGMIREIAKEELSNNQKYLLNNAQTASNHLLSIINNILDISKIESGEFKLNVHHFSIVDEINGVISILVNKAKSKNIQLLKEIEGSIAEAFMGDSAIIRQILLNLIGNSIKFSEKGNIKIRCSVLNTDEQIQEVEFCISDEGIGMDENYLVHIFKKFHQEDISNTRKFGGSGLGLAITKELIELMNGHIHVKSSKNIGTEITFNIQLPIGDKNQIQKIGNDDIYEILREKTILLVEDNPMNSLVAVNALRPYDAIITEATHGKQAVEILQKEKFDIILMDIQMPIMDGIQASKIIRTKLLIETPIIALTANAFKTELEKCKDAGMNTYVTKPFEEKELLNTICNELGKSINKKYALSEEQITQQPIKEHLTNNKLEEPSLYKLDYLIESSRGSKDFIKDMLLLFLNMIPSSIQQIEQSISTNNMAEFKDIVHKLKPSINSLRIPLEKEIKQVELLDTLLPTNARIKNLANKINRTLLECVNEMKEKEGL